MRSSGGSTFGAFCETASVEDESTSDTSSSSGSVNRNRRRTRSESNIERENDQSDTTGYNEIQWSHNRDRLI